MPVAVTMEVLARWAHERLAPTIRATREETRTVGVWEPLADFAGFAGARLEWRCAF
jgi:hypothetical protein